MSQTTSNKNEIVLGYWTIRGLAEPIRMALEYTKTPYTEKLYEQGEGPEYSQEEWLSEKQKLGLDFPNLPYLFEGNLKISQSKAILYYLGRKVNLMGKTPQEEAMVMMLCEEAHDLRMQLNGICYGPQGDSKEEQRKFSQTILSNSFKRFDDYFGKHKTKFAVGDQPTVADFQLYEYINSGLVLDGAGDVLEKCSHVKQFLETIRGLPEIKDYIAKVHAKLPFNNKVAKIRGTPAEQK